MRRDGRRWDENWIIKPEASSSSHPLLRGLTLTNTLTFPFSSWILSCNFLLFISPSKTFFSNSLIFFFAFQKIETNRSKWRRRRDVKEKKRCEGEEEMWRRRRDVKEKKRCEEEEEMWRRRRDVKKKKRCEEEEEMGW